MSSLSPASFLAIAGVVRKPAQRTAFLALIALFALATSIFLLSDPHRALHTLYRPSHNPHSQDYAHALDPHIAHHPSSRLFRYPGGPGGHRRPAQRPVRPQVQLTPAQELAAVTAFIASLPQNVIPDEVIPTLPLDPQLVLDFDTRSEHAEGEVVQMVADTWSANPVVVFSKFHSPVTRELKTKLMNLRLSPPPTIFDVDLRVDRDALEPLLMRLVDASALPVLLVGGRPVPGDWDEIKTLFENGEMEKMVTEAGAIVGGAKKTKGRGRKH